MLNFILMALAFMIGSFNVFYQGKKEKEYQNDERWKLILAKTNLIIRLYYEAIVFLCGLAYLVIKLLKLELSFTAEQLIIIIAYVVLLKIPIEYFSTRYFDQRL